jgi:3-dehydroquinate synthase
LEKIVLKTSGAGSEIYVGADLGFVINLIPGKGVVVITDDNVLRNYGDRFPDFPVISVAPGEMSKRLEIIGELAEKLLRNGIDRSGFILGIGGGVVCDITGFLASVYMRGIRCGYVSTTLLSQVDASTGGKTGVNLGDVKNIIGTIRQPEFVICDPCMLLTLSEQEYLSGLAELIKTAIIGDRELFELIEGNTTEILNRNRELLSLLVTRSVEFKASVVTVDEMETGLRRILNFGHTFGHAIELKQHFKHGFAVASGMELATEYSFEKGLINEDEKSRIKNLLSRFDLLQDYDLSAAEIEQLIGHDKKRAGGEIHFVFAEGIGNASVKKVAISEITDFYKRFKNKK